jgi:hypothetical protein
MASIGDPAPHRAVLDAVGTGPAQRENGDPFSAERGAACGHDRGPL